MKRHLFVEVWRNGVKDSCVGIADPFVTTKCEVVTEFSWWDWGKLLFTGRHVTTMRFHVWGDGVAHKRWFAGQDACDRCAKTIGFPHDGSNADDPGYHHGDERICEDCYYERPKPLAVAMACDSCSGQSL